MKSPSTADVTEVAKHNNPTIRIEDLLARAALRDHAAFRQLYEIASPPIYSMLLRLVRVRAVADEILQDSFVCIWQSAGSYMVSKSQPMTWITSIARNRALDYLRSSYHKTTVFQDEDGPAWDIADESQGVLDALVAESEAQTLRACLEALDANTRRCISAAFYRGLTHDQVATEVGAALGTVKSWIRRGLERLRRCLDDAEQRLE